MTRARFTDSDESRWFRDAPEDDVLPLDHPAMKQALAELKRLTDAELSAHSRDQREFKRRMGGGA